MKQFKHQWRVQRKGAWGSFCVAYIDARDVEQRLDDVFGVYGWTNTYHMIDDVLYCSISIMDPISGQWVTKTDCGTESVAEKEKGQSSDAFKRAAVRLGIGRYLYKLGEVYLPTTQDAKGNYEACRTKGDQGTVLKTREALSDFAQETWLKTTGKEMVALDSARKECVMYFNTLPKLTNNEVDIEQLNYCLNKITEVDDINEANKDDLIKLNGLFAKVHTVANYLGGLDDEQTKQARTKIGMAISTNNLSLRLTSENPLFRRNVAELKKLVSSLTI